MSIEELEFYQLIGFDLDTLIDYNKYLDEVSQCENLSD